MVFWLCTIIYILNIIYNIIAYSINFEGVVTIFWILNHRNCGEDDGIRQPKVGKMSPSHF